MLSHQIRQLIAGHQQLDRAALTRRPLDESQLLQTQDHLMDRWRRYPEIPLHVCFRRRTQVDLRVIVDEGEVLPLPGGIAADKSRRIFAPVVACVNWVQACECSLQQSGELAGGSNPTSWSASPFLGISILQVDIASTNVV